MFCDIDHFITLRTAAEQQAFGTFRTPLVWHKGDEGHAPWGRDGFKRTYELILYAVKGQKPLALSGGSDVKLVRRSTVDPARVHAAEKPGELLRLLLQLVCRAGDNVLDPCCGSGPIFTAAQGLGISITGCELNPETHTLAASRLANLGDSTPPESIINHPETSDDVMARLASLIGNS